MDETRKNPATDLDDSANPTEAAPDEPTDQTYQMPGPETSGEAESSAGDDIGAFTGTADAAGALGEHGGLLDTSRSFGDEASGSPEEGSAGTSGSRRPEVQQMVGQLQHMIDQLTTQASPALKEVAAKAAELAAAAAVRAGPIAHKAAGVTESVGQRVASKSSQVATNLRGARSPTTGTPVDDQPSTEGEAMGE